MFFLNLLVNLLTHEIRTVNYFFNKMTHQGDEQQILHNFLHETVTAFINNLSLGNTSDATFQNFATL